MEKNTLAFSSAAADSQNRLYLLNDYSTPNTVPSDLHVLPHPMLTKPMEGGSMMIAILQRGN